MKVREALSALDTLDEIANDGKARSDREGAQINYQVAHIVKILLVQHRDHVAAADHCVVGTEYFDRHDAMVRKCRRESRDIGGRALHKLLRRLWPVLLKEHCPDVCARLRQTHRYRSRPR